MISGVILDIDGTLLDSLPIWTTLGERYLSQFHICAEKNLNQILWPMSLAESAAYIKQKYHLSFAVDEIQGSILQLIETFYKDEVQLKAGVMEFLNFLQQKKIPMALATTGDRRLAEAAFERLNIQQYFQALYTASELNTTKREAKIYIEAAKTLQSKIEETYVVEDTFSALMTAKEAGFRTIAVYDEVGKADWENMKKYADKAVYTLKDLVK